MSRLKIYEVILPNGQAKIFKAYNKEDAARKAGFARSYGDRKIIKIRKISN